jgi:Fe-S-cluster containining protein
MESTFLRTKEEHRAKIVQLIGRYNCQSCSLCCSEKWLREPLAISRNDPNFNRIAAEVKAKGENTQMIVGEPGTIYARRVDAIPLKEGRCLFNIFTEKAGGEQYGACEIHDFSSMSCQIFPFAIEFRPSIKDNGYRPVRMAVLSRDCPMAYEMADEGILEIGLDDLQWAISDKKTQKDYHAEINYCLWSNWRFRKGLC